MFDDSRWQTCLISNFDFSLNWLVVLLFECGARLILYLICIHFDRLYDVFLSWPAVLLFLSWPAVALFENFEYGA